MQVKHFGKINYFHPATQSLNWWGEFFMLALIVYSSYTKGILRVYKR